MLILVTIQGFDSAFWASLAIPSGYTLETIQRDLCTLINRAARPVPIVEVREEHVRIVFSDEALTAEQSERKVVVKVRFIGDSQTLSDTLLPLTPDEFGRFVCGYASEEIWRVIHFFLEQFNIPTEGIQVSTNLYRKEVDTWSVCEAPQFPPIS